MSSTVPALSTSLFNEAFPKLQFWESNLKNSQFCKAESLKNCKNLPQNRERPVLRQAPYYLNFA
jgi:hypothetical protein